MIHKGRALRQNELIDLKGGEFVFVEWAKDDDPDYLRCYHVHRVIASLDNILTTAPVEFDDAIWEWDFDPEDTTIGVDTGRGYAYFYRDERKLKMPPGTRVRVKSGIGQGVVGVVCAMGDRRRMIVVDKEFEWFCGRTIKRLVTELETV